VGVSITLSKTLKRTGRMMNTVWEYKNLGKKGLGGGERQGGDGFWVIPSLKRKQTKRDEESKKIQKKKKSKKRVSGKKGVTHKRV